MLALLETNCRWKNSLANWSFEIADRSHFTLAIVALSEAFHAWQNHCLRNSFSNAYSLIYFSGQNAKNMVQISIDRLSYGYSICSILTLWSLSRSQVISAQVELWINTLRVFELSSFSKTLQFTKRTRSRWSSKTGLRYVWKRQLNTQTRSSTGLKNWAQLRIEICGVVFSTPIMKQDYTTTFFCLFFLNVLHVL